MDGESRSSAPALIVAATNRDLEEMVERNRFRADLLARFTDRHAMPPLRRKNGGLAFYHGLPSPE